MSERARIRLAFLAAAALSAFLLAVRHAPETNACAIGGATAYQPLTSEVATTMEGAGCLQLGPNYPSPPQIEAGPNSTLQTAFMPAIILKAIGYTESSWHQAYYTTPRGSSGPALVSGSCGYGIMQITSGMRNPGELPSNVQQAIAQDYVYNIAYGAKMLVEKWNYGPNYQSTIGDRDPYVGEDWYYAVWAYNGWSSRNDPRNPDLPYPRPVWNSPNSFTRDKYPYQELVWGYAAYPPSGLWQAVALTLPPNSTVQFPTVGWSPRPSPSHRFSCGPTAVLAVKPTKLMLTTKPGTNSPRAKVRLSDAGTGGFSWSVTTSTPWLTVSPTSGSGVPATLTVGANVSGLAAGVYSGSFSVSANGAQGSPKTVTVVLLISSHPGALPSIGLMLPSLLGWPQPLDNRRAP